MAYQAHWFLKNRILDIRFDGDVSLDNLTQAETHIYRCLEASPGTVHILIDIAEIAEVSISVKDLLTSEATRLVTEHPRLGWTIYYNDGKVNAMANMIATIVSQKTNTNIRILGSRADAIAFIREMAADPELAALLS